MSLRRRLFAPVIAALLPIVAIEAYNQVDLRAEREREIRGNALDQAKRVAAEQQRILDGVQNVLSTLVVLNSVRRQQAKRCDGLFAAVLPQYKGFDALVATRADGVPFCIADTAGTENASDLPSVGDEPFFRETIQRKQFTVGGYAYDSRRDTHVLRMAMPILDRSDRAVGVIYVNYNIEWLASRLGGTQWGGTQWNEGQAFSVVDRNGRILVRQPNSARYVGRLARHETWERVTAATGPFVFEATSRWDGVTRIFGIIPPVDGPGGLAVAVGVSRSVAFATLNAATLRGALVITVGAIGAFLLASLIGLRLVRKPIEGLLDATQRWRNGDLTARSNLSGPSELGRLGTAFDSMAEELGRALQFKDVLLRELRHRVMNNLQIISALFSLQARTMHDPEARAQFSQAVGRINAVAIAYRRMHPADGVNAIEFASYLRELCSALDDSLVEGQACQVEADSMLLDPQQASSLALVVNELVTNAIKHGDPNSPVSVKLDYSEERCRLAVRNFGLLPADYDAKNVEGFGTKMVAILVDQLDGTLDVSSGNGQTEFSVTFAPTAPQQGRPATTEERSEVKKASARRA